jgi:hypothetical protein
VEYFNQEDVVGHKFIAPVTHREYTNKDGEQDIKVDIKLFKVKPVPTVE